MIKAPALSRRLRTVFEMVPKCGTAADIGCDHAYLSINLYITGRAKRVYASDIREGPVAAARGNIARFECEENVKAVLAPGLTGVIDNDIDVYIISGMGGDTIVSILDEYKDRFSEKETFIIQPQSSVEDLRCYLYENGFVIEAERLCKDAGRLYTVMKVRFDGVKRSDDDVYYYIGRALIEGRDPLVSELTQRRIREHEKILSGLKSEKYKNRSDRVSKLICDMKLIMEEYESDSKANI